MRSSTIPHEPYADAVLSELEARAADLQDRSLASVFFGGGTPSLWSVDALKRVLDGIRRAFDVVEEALEVTAECNPSSLNGRSARALREAGVERLSIGVQSLDDEHLRFLGRLHDSHRATEALEEATQEVPRVSADVMFGMPGQEPDAFVDEIHRIVATGVEHVSAYALTIENQTLFGSLHKAGKLRIASDDRYAELFECAQACFTDAGWRQYEVSNYAIEGQESRHNVHYWRGGAYVGLGASAVGCLERGTGSALRWRNEPIPNRYLSNPLRVVETESLGPTEIIREAWMLGLRTAEGIDLRDTERRAGSDPCAGRHTQLERAIERGDLAADGDWLRVPQDRWLKLDGIVRDLF